MSKVETETAVAFGVKLLMNHLGEWKPLITARDAAIRAEVAEAIRENIHNRADKIATPEIALSFRLAAQSVDEVLREFTPAAAPAQDAKVENIDPVKAAKLEVLREMLSHDWDESFMQTSATLIRDNILAIAARHGITPAELGPRALTVDDIKVVAIDDSMGDTRNVWSVKCGAFNWCARKWVGEECSMSLYSKHDAEAIASHLRTTENLPQGGGE